MVESADSLCCDLQVAADVVGIMYPGDDHQCLQGMVEVTNDLLTLSPSVNIIRWHKQIHHGSEALWQANVHY